MTTRAYMLVYGLLLFIVFVINWIFYYANTNKPNEPVKIVIDLEKTAWVLEAKDNIWWQTSRYMEDPKPTLDTIFGILHWNPVVIITGEDTLNYYVGYPTDTIRIDPCDYWAKPRDTVIVYVNETKFPRG